MSADFQVPGFTFQATSSKCQETDELSYSVEQIRGMMGRRFYEGFTGTTCKGCRKNVNILAGRKHWMCCCGTVNEMPAAGVEKQPWDRPHYGPTKETIGMAEGWTAG